LGTPQQPEASATTCLFGLRAATIANGLRFTCGRHFSFSWAKPRTFFLCFHLLCSDDELQANRKNVCQEFSIVWGQKKRGSLAGEKCVACEKNGKRDTGGKMVGKTGVGRGRLADGVTFFFGFPLYLATKETETETEEATNTNTYEKWAKTLSS